jgi:NADH-quinone oxidoreductase subunit N
MIYLLSSASVAAGGLLSAGTPHLRTLLAFSGIAHIGYLLSGSALTLYPLFLYSLAYTGIFSLFCVILASSSLRSALRLSSLRGLANLHTLPAVAIQVASFGLGGMPPLLGFFSKSYILSGGVSLGNEILQPVMLVCLGVVGMVAYLRIALATVGYPQTYNHLVQPMAKRPPGGGPKAALLGLILGSELLMGDVALGLFA